MDIGGLTSLYSNYITQEAGKSGTADAISKASNTDMTKATDDELMEVCKEFEAYFVEQMYKEMLKTVPESELSSGANSTMMDYYKDNAVQSIAGQTVEQNGLGLAQTLYEQMKRNYEI